jgi:hypothetical protein
MFHSRSLSLQQKSLKKEDYSSLSLSVKQRSSETNVGYRVSLSQINWNHVVVQYYFVDILF